MAAPTLNRLVLTDDDGSGYTGTPLNNALFQDLQNRIDTLSANIVAQLTAELGARPGDIVVLSGPLRAGLLEADGGEYGRATYPVLNAVYASLGYPYGAGNGSTTFNTPDLRGRTPIGVGAGPGLTARSMGEKLGAEAIALVEAQIPSHLHPVTDPTHAHNVYDPGHAHGVTDPTHAHGVYDPTHAHGVSDPGHNHVLNDPKHGHPVSDPGHGHGAYGYESVEVGPGGQTMGTPGYNVNVLWDHVVPGATGVTVGAAGTGMSLNPAGVGVGVNAGPTGIGIYGAGTGVTVNGAGTSIGIYATGTGVAVGAAGGNGAHSNVQPSLGLRFGVKT